MKKTLALLLAASFTAAAGVASADPFLDREAILTKAKAQHRSVVDIGFYPGPIPKSAMFYWAQRFLPFANYMSDRTGNIVSLVPEQNVTVLKNLVKAQHYKWLYVSPEIAVLAEEMGYTPIVRADGNTESVLVTTPKSPIQKVTDLDGVRVGIANATGATLVAQYKFKNMTPKAVNPVYVEAGTSLQGQLHTLLDSGVVAAVIISREQAEAILKSDPTKYRIADSMGQILGSVLLAHTTVPNAEVETMRAAYLGLQTSEAAHVKVMSGYNFKSKGTNYFIDFDRDYLAQTRKVLAFTEPDYGRTVFNTTTQKWFEAYQLFAKDTRADAAKAPAAPAAAAPVSK
jgi:ABC-type phosphate/phosphonate transport system substrate-binding protein